jgi:hypothetical protein
MTLKDVKDAYEGLSAKASDIVRQLALAGIGIAWLFRNTTGGVDRLDPKLIDASFLIVFALLFDLLQYLVSGTIWLVYFRHKEKQKPKLKPETEFEAPPSLNWPNFAFFYLKAAALFAAYVLYIIPYLWWRLGAKGA